MIDERVPALMTLALLCSVPAQAAEKRVVIPSTFDGDRVFVDLMTASGAPLKLYTDTGGGALILYPATAERLGLDAASSDDPQLRAELGPNAKIATAPQLSPLYPPLPARALVAPPILSSGDGFVGAPWFAGGIWTWDYPRHRMVREADGTKVRPGPHVIPIAFKTGPDGKRPFSFGRIAVTIDGETVQVLLDTGAMTKLTPAALARMQDSGSADRATSMIVASLFDRWHRDHPDWPYIEDGQAGTHSAMIEVPNVGIAGYSVGPVWFTRRADRNFHEWMSSMMDSRIEGAVGGNLFRHFSMTVDYPSGQASFRCKLECGSVRGRGE